MKESGTLRLNKAARREFWGVLALFCGPFVVAVTRILSLYSNS